MTDKEVMQMALDALLYDPYFNDCEERLDKAIEVLRVALEQPEPAECDGGKCGIGGYCKECPKTKPELKIINMENFVGSGKPIALRFYDGNMWCYVDHLTNLPQDKFEPLYTEPPKKEWVGLADEEVMSLLPGAVRLPPGWVDTVRVIEAKLKEKNT